MIYNFFEIMFLLPIILVGSLCVFTDLKNKKIYNKVIIFGFVYGLILFLYFSLIQYNGAYLFSALVNFLISIFVSYALWFYNCWSAGDAKLFSLFSFLLPLSFYEKLNYPFFPSFNILINLFIPVVIFLFVLSILNIIKERKLNIKKFFGSIAIFLKASFIYILIYLLIEKAFGPFLKENLLLFRVLYLFFMFFTIRAAKDFFNKHFFLNYFVIFCILVYSFYLVFHGEGGLVQAVFLKVYLFLGTIFVLNMVINSYIDKCDVEKIKVDDLKVGMVVFSEENKMEKVEDKNIKTFLKKGGFVKKYKNFSFSIFIFIAVIITILIKGSLLIFIF